MYEYPFGNGQQLNLDWFLAEWKNLLAAWEAEKNGIEGALQAEIDRAEAALADVFAARDAAAQSAANALESKNAAAQSASDASGYLATVRADANTASNAAQNAAQSESNAAESAQTAVASKNTAANSERNAAQSEANANSSKNAAAQSAADALAHKDAAAQSAADALANKDAAAQSASDAEDAASSVEASAQQIETNKNDIVDLKNDLDIIEKIAKGSLEQKTVVNQEIVEIHDGADNVPIIKFIGAITPAQDGEGTPSPSNIRRINGWTSDTIIISPTDNTEDGESFTIDFPEEAGVVYGGFITIDETGEATLTVNRALVTFDGTITNFTFDSGSSTNRIGWYTYNNIGDSLSSFISDKLQSVGNSSGISPVEWAIYNSNTSTSARMFITTPKSITSVEDFIAYTRENVIRVVYYLKTPTIYNLSNTQLKTLLNNNYITNSDGIIRELTYYANGNATSIKAIICKEMNSMIANEALYVNDFRIVQNKLYKITSNIANGSLLIVGTNCVETTIASEITKILNS